MKLIDGILRKAVLLAALGLSAASASAADTIVGEGQITLISLWEGHSGVLIKTSQAMIDPDACGRTDYYIVPDTLTHYDKIYALLLTAYSAGQPVTIHLNGCVQGLPAVRHIRTQKN